MIQSARPIPLQVARMMLGLPVRLTADDLFAGLEPEQARKYLGRLDPEPPLAQYQLLLRAPARHPKPRVPVIVVGAEAHRLVPLADSQRTADLYATKPLWIPDAGHAIMLDRGREQALDRTLESLSQALNSA